MIYGSESFQAVPARPYDKGKMEKLKCCKLKVMGSRLFENAAEKRS